MGQESRIKIGIVFLQSRNDAWKLVKVFVFQKISQVIYGKVLGFLHNREFSILYKLFNFNCYLSI